MKIPNKLQLFSILFILVWILIFNYVLVIEKYNLLIFLTILIPAIILLLYLFVDPDLFLFAIIFLVPLSIKTDFPGGFSISIPSEILCLLILSYFLFFTPILKNIDKGLFKHPIFIIIVIQLVWFLICSLLSTMPLVSLKRTFILSIYFLVFFVLFFTKFNKPENIFRFYLLYAFGLVIPIVNSLYKHSDYHFIQQMSATMPQPFFAEHTLYGASLAFIVPLLILVVFVQNNYLNSWKSKITIFSLFILICIAEFFSYSRAAWISLLMTPLLLIILRLKIKLVYHSIIVIIAVAGIIIFSDQIFDIISKNKSRSGRGDVKEQFESVSNIHTDISNLERINRWKCAIRMFKERPLIGFGPGTYQFQYGVFQVRSDMTRISTYDGDKGNAHSEYLGYLSESGLPGLLIYLVSIFIILNTSLKIIYKSNNKLLRQITIVVLLGLSTYYFHTLFNGFIDNIQIGALYFGSLAAITAIDLSYFTKEQSV